MSLFGQSPTPATDLLHAWMLWQDRADLDLVALYELYDGSTGAVFSQAKGGAPGNLARAPWVLIPEDEPELPEGWPCREDLFATHLDRFRQLWLVGINTGRLVGALDAPVKLQARGALVRVFGEQPVELEFDEHTVAVVLHTQGADARPGLGLDLAGLRALPGGATLVDTLADYEPPPIVVRLRWESEADLDLVCRVVPGDGCPPTRLEPGYPGTLDAEPWAVLSRDEGGLGRPVQGSKAEHLLLPRLGKIAEVMLFARIRPDYRPSFEYHAARVFIAVGQRHTVLSLDHLELGHWCTVARITGGLTPRVEPINLVSREAPEAWGDVA